MTTPFWAFDEYDAAEAWDYNDEFAQLDEEALRYGPLTDRPAAADVPDGRRWLDEYGRVSRSEADSWVVDPVGTSTDPIPEVNADLLGATGTVQRPRGAPTTDDLDDGERMVYVSDGSDAYAAGDLVSARNDAGAIVSQVLAAAADDA